MWQILLAVLATTLLVVGTLLLSLRYLVSIVLSTTGETAKVLTAALNPPITDSDQPMLQPDLLDPNWTPGEDGLPIPPWMQESGPSSSSTYS